MIQGLYKIFDNWHEKGTVWIISDPHFGDKELAAGVKNRPSDDELVRMINTKCGRADTLICLGDVGDVAYVSRLRANIKILVCGNHDLGTSNYERDISTMIFDKTNYPTEAGVKEYMKEKFPNYEIRLADIGFSWFCIYDNNLFDYVFQGPLMIAEKLILSHEPVDVSWAFNIHGHCHSPSHKNDKLHFNACLDATGYEVINFNQWMKQGHLAHVETLHRDTINAATVRKQKRGGKKIGER